MPRHTFRAQLILGFAVVIAVAVVAQVSAILVYRHSDDLREQRLTSYWEDLRLASKLQFYTERLVSASRGYFLTTEPPLLAKVEAAERELDGITNQLGRHDAAAMTSEHPENIRKSIADYRVAFDQLVAAQRYTSDRRILANNIEATLLPKRAALDAQVERFIESNRDLLDAEIAAARKASEHLLHLVTGIGGTGTLLAGLFAWLVARRLDNLYEREILATTRAENATAARDELLGVVAHDLRSPLNAIVLKAAFIKESAGRERAKTAAESIEKIGMRMAHLITSLLDAASIEAGHFTLHRAQCSVSEILDATLDVFRGLAAQKSIDLEHEVSPQGLNIFCDRERISQVLSNLLTNALKFTPDGGNVQVRVSQTRTSARFEVRDSGAGVAPEHLGHLFERYWKPGDKQGGTGLGLYIAKAIVTAHGGQIRVTSVRGRGSLFAFDIPLAGTHDALERSADCRLDRGHPSPAQ